eukprot:gene6906-9067_t
MVAPACANSWLLETYVKTAEEAVAVTLKAGMDVDCSYFVGRHGMKALELGRAPAPGLINESLVDARLANLFRVRMRLQHFDPPGPLQRIPPAAVCTPAAAAVARDGVAQGAA